MSHSLLKCVSRTRFCASTTTTQLKRTTIRLSSTSAKKYDVTIVGGGIVGLATARELIHRWPNLSYAVIEKEDQLSIHQTGHNSGVIHAGIYYTPGSLKAKLCVEGLKLTYKYCDEQNIPYKKVGKLIVAVNEEELPRLDNLYKRALQNGCSVSMVDKDEIKQIEPYCEGLKAIHSPLTGIVDFGLVARTYGKEFSSLGGDIHTGFEVTDFKESSDSEFPITIEGKNSDQTIYSKHMVVCGGLFADRLAAKSGCNMEPKIVPFRGDYLVLKPEKQYLVKGNIYPVPDPRFPFLGVHYTPRMDGSVWLGPNAVLAFRREGYKFFDFNLKDFTEAIAFRGLRKLVAKNLTAGVGELYRVANRSAQVKQLQRFIPELTNNDVTKGPSGVRAQPLDGNGNLVDDFVFDSGTGSLGKRMLHVRSAPSPAATSSMAIAQMVADEVKMRFQL
uniref:L-2-hydroxyglutarate dehydrogenase, mitochondrial n=1 Tax=Phallusia mammillata TaxID=59560 RepID=A0A6F9DGV8_9ASCI|nr:L-2-hydroxyglutarate dehydrogenase, mitochondrial-like [Phallusia mammillata]